MRFEWETVLDKQHYSSVNVANSCFFPLASYVFVQNCDPTRYFTRHLQFVSCTDMYDCTDMWLSLTGITLKTNPKWLLCLVKDYDWSLLKGSSSDRIRRLHAVALSLSVSLSYGLHFVNACSGAAMTAADLTSAQKLIACPIQLHAIDVGIIELLLLRFNKCNS